MHRRSPHRLTFLSLVAFALLAPGIAQAQPQDYSVLIDSDNSDATGCTVGSPPEAFLGADFRVVTTVNTSVDPPLVTNLALEVCTTAPSTWSPFAGPDPFTEFPTPFPAPTDGIYDAIESYVPLAILASGPVLQVGFFSGPITDPQDVLFTTNGAPGGPAIQFGVPVVAIPTLAEWSMLLLALLLLTTGVVALRRRASRAGLMLGLLLISGGLGVAIASSPHAADGNILDWTGHLPIASDALPPDAGANADIFRAFAHFEGHNVFFRHDANNAPNGPPQAVDDTATVAEDSGPTTIDVLANDNDPPPADVFTIGSVTQPANGTVVITNGGADLTYQPDADYCNTPIPPGTPDTFTYTLTPVPSTATVSVTVTCVDDAPVAVDDAATVAEDAAATSIDVLANDTDPDGGPKTIASATDPANGTVVVAGDGLSLTYQPDPAYCNTPPGTTLDTFDYTLAPGGDTATVTVTVTCDDDPPTAVDDAATVAEDSGATSIDVLANDTDPDGGPKTIASATDPANGTVVVAGDGLSLTYQPDPDYCNTPIPPGTADTFQYTLSPGGSSATVSVTVTCADDNPVAVDDSATVAEDSGATLIDVLANDTDSESDPFTIASATDPANGTVVIAGDNLSLTYQPDPDYCNAPIPPGTADTFTYTLSPGGDSATVSVTVTCADDDPVAVDDAPTVAEDSGATLVDVLANDTDVDAGPKSIASATDPANGTVVVAGDGLSLTYQPDPDYCNTPPGSTLDTFTYTLAPGGDTATVSVTVTCVDDAPLAVDDAATVGEDSGATLVDVLTNDTDIDGGPKTIASATDPANGTVVVAGDGLSLTYQPDPDYCNTPIPPGSADTFTYTLAQGGADPTATVSVTVTCANDGPAIDLDADDDKGTGGADFAVTFTEGDAATLLEDPVDATLTDVDSATIASLTVTLTNILDPTFEVLDADISAFAGTLTKVYDTTTTPGTGVLTISGTESATNYETVLRTVTYLNSDTAPDSTARTVTFVANDGTNDGNTATSTVTVVGEDTDPTAVADSATVDEDSGATLIDVLANDTDPDGGPKTIASATDPANGTVVVAGDNLSLTYQPDANYCNTPIPPGTADTFQYTLSPGGSSTTVSVTVTCVDDNPVAVADSATVDEDAGATLIDVLANDTDADGGAKTIASATDPANGTVVVAGDNLSLTYQPDANYCNTPIPPGTADTFQYTLSPGGSSTTVSVTVTCVDDNPVAVADSATVTEDAAATPIDVLANDTDVDGGTKTIASATDPANGTVVVAGDNLSLTYQPDPNYCNTPIPPGTADTFQYTLNPGGSSTTVSVTVTCVNDPPVANPDTADITEEAPNVAAANTVSGNVLTNDTDPDSVLTVTVVNGSGANVGNPVAGTYGSVTINSNGSYTYTLDDTNPLVNALAPGGMLVEPAFNYTASDGSLTSSSTLTITIHGADDPPTPDDDPFDFIGNTELQVDCVAGACNEATTTPRTTEATPADPAAHGVLDGDVDVDGGGAITITSIVGCADVTAPFDCVLAGQGTVHLEADGSFTFVPEAGDTDPTATFDYVLNNNVADPGTVPLTRFERVWYVDPAAGGGGNGTSTSPFNTLDPLDGVGGAGDSDLASDYIFVHDGTLALSAPMPMEASQHLIGQGHVAVTSPSNFALSIPVNLNGNGSPTNLVATTTHPQVTNATGDAVTVGPAIPIEIVGLSLASTTANAIDLTTAAALTGSSSLTIGNNQFRGAGAEGIDVNLNVSTTGTLALNVTNNTWDLAGTHTLSAVAIDRAAGTLHLTFSGNTNLRSSGASTALVINGGVAANTIVTAFAGNSVHGNTGGTGINVSTATFDANTVTGGFQQVDGDNLSIGALGNPVGGAGMALTTVQGNLFFDDLDIYAASGTGLQIAGSGGMTFAVTPSSPDGSGTSVIDADNGAALDISNATIDLRLDDLDSNTTVSGVTLNNVAGQLKTDSDASITKAGGAGTAFSVANGTVSVDYAGTLNVTSGSGVSHSANTGTTTFRGGMTLSTGANTAFSASGGGTVNVIDPAGLTNNAVTTTTATAVSISGTTIGASGVTFESVNSATASSNTVIVLANTGTGAFSITGTGGAGSGGTIDNKTADAMTLNNTDGLVTLNGMIIEDIGNTAGGFDTISNHDAIHGQQVDGGMTLTGTTIRRISDAAIHGATLVGNAATVWNGLTITNSTIENTNRWHVPNVADDNNEGMVRILGIRGTVSVTNSTLQDGAEMIDFFVTGGTLNMTATNNSFNRAYKEFTSGPLASQGGHCVDVTVQGASNANVTIGDRINDALDNNFLNCRLASLRVAADSTATGNIDVIVGRNDFTVNDHSSGFGGDFDFPQGGVLLSSQPTTPDSMTFDAVVDGNYFDEIANASGGVGQLTLAMANGSWQVLVQNNTFDTPGNAPWFVRADSTSSAKVKFQNNIGIKGFFNCPDPSCAGGFNGPGLRALVDLQNGAVADVTILNDQFAEHDAGFDPGQTFEARNLNTGGGGTLCLDLQNNQAPDGYSLEEFAGDFNLVGSGTCPVGSPSPNCQTLLGARGNRGGANVATTNPPFVNVEVGATIDVVAAACQQPSGAIF